MSALYCDRCGSPWSNHENCDDDPGAQTRHLRHIEQLQRELIEDGQKVTVLTNKLKASEKDTAQALRAHASTIEDYAALKASHAELHLLVVELYCLWGDLESEDRDAERKIIERAGKALATAEAIAKP